jgi:hypothetical protein
LQKKGLCTLRLKLERNEDAQPKRERAREQNVWREAVTQASDGEKKIVHMTTCMPATNRLIPIQVLIPLVAKALRQPKRTTLLACAVAQRGGAKRRRRRQRPKRENGGVRFEGKHQRIVCACVIDCYDGHPLGGQNDRTPSRSHVDA